MWLMKASTFLVKMYSSKTHSRINVRSFLSMKFRDKFMPTVCVFRIPGSSHAWNFRLILVLIPIDLELKQRAALIFYL